MTQEHDKETAGVSEQLARTEGYLQSDPGNRGLLAQVIDLSLAAGDPARARRHAQAAVSAYPADPYFLYRWAHVLMSQGEWSEADSVLAQLAEQHRDLNVAYSLATCRMKLQRFQDAYEALAPYQDDAGLPAAPVTLMVRALHHAGDLDAGAALVERERERLAGEGEFLGAAALLMLDAGRADDAASLSDAAIAAGGSTVEALVANASVALARDDAGAAIERFNQVLAVHPQEGRSWAGLGMASMLRRDLAGAMVQLRQAVRYMPEHIGTWLTLGWCMALTQDLSGAEEAFGQALALDRNFGESHGAVAVVAALRGERAQAEASIERALRLDPQSLSARYAQMVLSGQTADPERFKAIAMRLLSGRKTAFGDSLADVVSRRQAE